MNKTRIFIDGKEGTTGLRIYERLSERKDIELMLISDELRKDVNARKENNNISALILKGLGGKDNISDVDACATRLRVTVNDEGKVDENGCANCRTARI